MVKQQVKICSVCSKVKLLSAFSLNAHCSDGRLNKCNVCRREHRRKLRLLNAAAVNARQKAYREKHRKQIRKKAREWAQRNKLKVAYWRKRYRDAHTDKLNADKKAYYRSHRDVVCARITRWGAYNPEKKLAHRKVAAAVSKGLLVAPERCSNCGRKVRLHGHHRDYNKSTLLDVVWLCGRCHRREHLGIIDKGGAKW